MDENLKEWKEKYRLEGLQMVGYRGGYPIIQFDLHEGMKGVRYTQRERDKIVRKAEMNGGIEVGVGYNFRRTAFVRIETTCNKIVICGHPVVIEKILNEII